MITRFSYSSSGTFKICSSACEGPIIQHLRLLDSFHMILVSVSIYHYLISNYNNPSALAYGHWSLYVSVIANIVIASVVQGFFTLRIFQLCSQRIRWWVAGFIIILIIAHVGFGLETVAFFFMKQEFSKLSDITLVAAMPFAIFAVLTDIVIAIALCILLNENRTSFSRTNAIISTLMVYAINRCLLTSVVAIVEIIVFAAAPKSLWFLAIDFCIGKLWANSLLATLNSRNFVNGNGDHSINTTTRISNLEFSDQSTGVTGTDTSQSYQLRSIELTKDPRKARYTDLVGESRTKRGSRDRSDSA